MSFYVASRTKHADRWRHMRARGAKIVSSWIDEAGPGETLDYAEFWTRVSDEIAQSHFLLLYVEPDDFPLKGAFVEVGIALGREIPVTVCAPGVEIEDKTFRPLGSWLKHPLVKLDNNFMELLPK